MLATNQRCNRVTYSSFLPWRALRPLRESSSERDLAQSSPRTRRDGKELALQPYYLFVFHTGELCALCDSPLLKKISREAREHEGIGKELTGLPCVAQGEQQSERNEGAGRQHREQESHIEVECRPFEPLELRVQARCRAMKKRSVAD